MPPFNSHLANSNQLPKHKSWYLVPAKPSQNHIIRWKIFVLPYSSQDTTGQISAVLEHIVDHDHILVQSYQYSKLCWARPQLEVWMILVQRLMQCHFIAMARSLLPCLAAHNEQWILSTCVKRHNDWCPLWMGQVCDVCVLLFRITTPAQSEFVGREYINARLFEQTWVQL